MNGRDESTRRLRPPADAGADEDEYSATALDVGWSPADVQRDAPAHPAIRQDVRPDRVPPSAPAVPAPPVPAPPQGPATGEVLRFGPGVPRRDTAADVWRAGAPADRPPGKRRRGWPPYLLAALVLLAVAGFLAWQRFGVPLRVQSVSVTAPQQGPRCDGTAVITATVATNGRPGTLRYRWWRSDGTRSGLLTEQVGRGQRKARLQLQWSFRGRGRVDARAELRLVTPQRRVSSAEFTYACP